MNIVFSNVSEITWFLEYKPFPSFHHVPQNPSAIVLKLLSGKDVRVLTFQSSGLLQMSGEVEL
jgi:hypothetical protein